MLKLRGNQAYPFHLFQACLTHVVDHLDMIETKIMQPQQAALGPHLLEWCGPSLLKMRVLSWVIYIYLPSGLLDAPQDDAGFRSVSAPLNAVIYYNRCFFLFCIPVTLNAT